MQVKPVENPQDVLRCPRTFWACRDENYELWRFQYPQRAVSEAVEVQNKPDCLLHKVNGRYQGISSREALRKAAALAAALERLGVTPSQRIALISENRPEWTLTDYAILGLGGITVPIYPTLLEPDVEFILRDSNCEGVVVATDGQLRKVLNVQRRLPSIKFVLAVDCSGVVETGAVRWENCAESALNWSDAARTEAFKARALAARPGDVASLVYTSGTMGQPQGVILTHSNIASNVRSASEVFPLDSSDVLISFLPLSHVFERMVEFLCFWKGVSIAFAEGLETLPQNLREIRPTVMAVVPRVLEKIHDQVMDGVRRLPAAKRRIFDWALKVGKSTSPFTLNGRTCAAWACG